MIIPFIWFIFNDSWVVVEEETRRGGVRYKIYRKSKERLWTEPRIEFPKEVKIPHKRSNVASVFIDEVQRNILETGVVKNSSKEYNSKTNKRFKVDPHQARVIAWKIAKSKGLRVGRRPPHRKK